MNPKLVEVLKGFDLPCYRKEKGTPQNLKWLLKNLSKRNANNPKYDKAMELIKDELGVKQ